MYNNKHTSNGIDTAAKRTQEQEQRRDAREDIWNARHLLARKGNANARHIVRFHDFTQRLAVDTESAQRSLYAWHQQWRVRGDVQANSIGDATLGDAELVPGIPLALLVEEHAIDASVGRVNSVVIHDACKEVVGAVPVKSQASDKRDCKQHGRSTTAYSKYLF